MYSVFLNNILLPVTPGSITIDSDGKNEVVELIDGSEINVLKVPGLKTVNFEARLPQTVLPFAVYEVLESSVATISYFSTPKSSKQSCCARELKKADSVTTIRFAL